MTYAADSFDTLPHLPAWVTARRAETPEDVSFLSGAALAALHLVQSRTEVLHTLLRAEAHWFWDGFTRELRLLEIGDPAFAAKITDNLTTDRRDNCVQRHEPFRRATKFATEPVWYGCTL